MPKDAFALKSASVFMLNSSVLINLTSAVARLGSFSIVVRLGLFKLSAWVLSRVKWRMAMFL
jgi:hypothetical protein